MLTMLTIEKGTGRVFGKKKQNVYSDIIANPFDIMFVVVFMRAKCA